MWTGRGAPELSGLIYLANECGVSAPTHNQVQSALLFLYKEVLRIELAWLDEVVTPRTSRRLPVVLMQREVAALLHGTGLRLLEGLCLRVKDVEFTRREVIVREGKDGKDRVTVLPENLIEPLQAQIARARACTWWTWRLAAARCSWGIQRVRNVAMRFAHPWPFG